jgi:hypothetical protein
MIFGTPIAVVTIGLNPGGLQMETLTILLLIFGLGFFLMRRGGMGMGCCGGHSHGTQTEQGEKEDVSKTNP